MENLQKRILRNQNMLLSCIGQPPRLPIYHRHPIGEFDGRLEPYGRDGELSQVMLEALLWLPHSVILRLKHLKKVDLNRNILIDQVSLPQKRINKRKVPSKNNWLHSD